MFKRVTIIVAVASMTLLAACGGGGGGGGGPPPPPTTYTIGGSVSGLSGSGLVLRNNGGDSLAVAGNGAFTFGAAVASGATYSVTVQTQPSAPAQTCAVASGTGTATARMSGAYEFVTRAGRTERQPASFEATFVKDGDRWVLQRVR